MSNTVLKNNKNSNSMDGQGFLFVQFLVFLVLFKNTICIFLFVRKIP
jgi:hypothetical protein